MDEFKKIIKVSWDFTNEGVKKFIQDTNENITKNLKNTMDDIGETLSSIITNAFKDSISEMKEMLEYSQLSSSRTRELAFGYGFSAPEAYGYEKALQLVGLESEEDLYYANTQELQQFREAFEKYSNKYSKLYDAGYFEKMQEFQYEMEDFKQEMMLEVVEFFMENKDLIKTGMEWLIKASEAVIKMFAWLVKIFSTSEEAISTTDIINQYSEIRTSSTNVNVNNNFNGVNKGDEGWLADMGNLTYQQVIKALGGDV